MLVVSFFSLFLLLLALTLLHGSALGDEYRISSKNDFTSFVRAVNGGSSYSGTTVLLDSDITLSELIDPIGISDNYFSGVFDGQGHIIRGLTINPSSHYSGLFGYSSGLTIRNVVLDDSCSITSSYDSSGDTCVGSIIGYCPATNGDCIIDNTVNMANIAFEGTTQTNLFFGGIAGHLLPSSSSSSYNTYIKNCANYGHIKKTGTSSCSRIGGIVGYSRGEYSNKYIQNCINYGSIDHSGRSSDGLYIGGIIGSSSYTAIKNSISVGKIIILNEPITVGKGSIVGEVNSGTDINYCYFTSDVGISNLYGKGSTPSSVGTPPTATILDSSLVSELNAQATSGGWNKWVLNTGSASVTFRVNGNNGFSLSGDLVILPSLASDSSSFSGWFTDSNCTQPFSSGPISGATTLYGGWLVAVTFNANGGGSGVTPSSKSVILGSTYGDLPEATRTGHTFTGWFTAASGGAEVKSYTEVTTQSGHTLYAHWEMNRYTISFVTNGGSECPNITQEYGSPVTLPEPNRTGYTFAHWCSDAALKTEYRGTAMPAGNVILYAKWTANEYTVSFDSECGVSHPPITVVFGGTYDIPEQTRGDSNVLWWDVLGSDERVEDGLTVSIARNHSLCAVWDKNNVTLDATGGHCDVDTVVVEYGKTYGDLPEAMKTGHSFVGWFNDKNESITKDTVVISPYPHTLTAQWNNTNTTEYVEIVFETKDLNEDNIREIVEKYTHVEFTIELIEGDEAGGTKVIIKFVNKGAAENFVEKITGSSNEKNNIRKVGFIHEIAGSMSSSFCPFYLLCFLF